MRILITGHGRMGKLIESTALSMGHTVAGVISSRNAGELTALGAIADIIIDFSAPALIPALCEYAVRTGTPLLSGTTGLTDADMAQLQTAAASVPVIHSGNYSTGIAIFREILERYASVLLDGFDCEIVETHHNQKADAPSGTAKLLYQAIDPNGEYTPTYGREGITGKRPEKQIGIHSLRGGTVAGTHTVSFFGGDETIEITHTAASRQIFVNGALRTAEKLIARPAGFYTIRQLLF